MNEREFFPCAICGAPRDAEGDCTIECAHTGEAQFQHLLDRFTVAGVPVPDLDIP